MKFWKPHIFLLSNINKSVGILEFYKVIFSPYKSDISTYVLLLFFYKHQSVKYNTKKLFLYKHQ